MKYHQSVIKSQFNLKRILRIIQILEKENFWALFKKPFDKSSAPVSKHTELHYFVTKGLLSLQKMLILSLQKVTTTFVIIPVPVLTSSWPSCFIFFKCFDPFKWVSNMLSELRTTLLKGPKLLFLLDQFHAWYKVQR